MMNNKKAILIIGRGNNNWIGGQYYTRNVAYQLSRNNNITEKYNILVACNSDNEEFYRKLPDQVEIIKIDVDSRIHELFEEILLIRKYRITYIYPRYYNMQWLGVTCIGWMADFQHDLFPEYFSEEEYNARRKQFMKVADNHQPLILSSNSCLRDFKKYYRKDRKNVCVMPFVSYIEPEVREMQKRKKSILEKYGLCGIRYAYIGNQFWQHKNHIVVLKAIEKLIQNKMCRIHFVFSGKMHDYRDSTYVDDIKKYFENDIYSSYVMNLGFLDRIDQLAIMNSAEFIIQPSLCEGWGTVVEDAKVLDKTILLSDIEVHHEQKNDKCKFFDANNPEKLAELILNEQNEKHESNVDAGIENMKERALLYSREFEKIVCR
ncbi:glycosyltransferase [Bacillota bacterium LCP21S3_A4]